MIRRLYLHNFSCYRGEHVIDLGPKAYAITARHEEDPGRSNAAGKSTLLEAIDFALFGRLKDVKERGWDADGWITRGEKEGTVTVILEDGLQIERTRRRGKATQVRAKRPPATADASQEAATALVAKHLGFSADDFKNAAYFEQRRMARLLHADPADRLGVVSGWLGLGLGDRGIARAGAIAAEHARELGTMTARRGALEGLSAPAGEPESFDFAAAEAELATWKAQVEGLEAERHALRESEHAAELISEFEQIVARGKVLRAQVDAADPNLELEAGQVEKNLGMLAQKHADRVDDVRRRRRIALGQFDGKCPVAGIACPAKDAINEDREMSAEQVRLAEAAELGARQCLEVRQAEGKAVLARRDDLVASRTKLEELRAWVAERSPRIKEARKLVTISRSKLEIDADIEIARATYYEKSRAHSAARAAVEARARHAEEISRLTASIERETKAADLAVRAAAVFRAAQRRVAERALDAISDDATSLLAGAGSDLEVGFRWERAGKDPAKQCERCGGAFPTSAKVKQCERCGAARGMHLVPRLDFLVSQRSGGADDFAGVAMQLSAGTWLLEQRQSHWSTGMIDEPFGALDATHRRGGALALAKTSWYRQLLVISHDPVTTAVFPGRIEVTVDAAGERRVKVT